MGGRFWLPSRLWRVQSYNLSGRSILDAPFSDADDALLLGRCGGVLPRLCRHRFAFELVPSLALAPLTERRASSYFQASDGSLWPSAQRSRNGRHHRCLARCRMLGRSQLLRNAASTLPCAYVVVCARCEVCQTTSQVLAHAAAAAVRAAATPQRTDESCSRLRSR